MEKQFIPYELAVKLKELGFDEPCLGVWNIPNGEYEVTLVYGGKLHEGYINDIQSFKVCAPLWQQAEDFLLKKYNLYGIIIPTITMHWTFKTMTVAEGIVEVPPYKHVDSNDYSSVEEARQACLEKLIKIIETK